MFNSEADLQKYLASRLSGAKTEVVTHQRAKTRADIVVGNTVIECKKVLGRDEIHQAYSQAAMYAKHLGKQSIVLVGMPPFGEEAQRSAKAAAFAVASTHENVSIRWLNQGGVIPLAGKRCVIDSIKGAGVSSPIAAIAVSRSDAVKPLVFWGCVALGWFAAGWLGIGIGIIAGGFYWYGF